MSLDCLIFKCAGTAATFGAATGGSESITADYLDDLRVVTGAASAEVHTDDENCSDTAADTL